MLNRLCIALFLLIGFSAAAQDNISISTVIIDYKQAGAPMPGLIIATYHDSTKTGDELLSRKDKKRLIKDPMANQKVKLVAGNDLKNNSSLLVMIFNPTCQHCEATTDMLEQNIALFGNSNIVLVATSHNTEYIPLFTKKHNTGFFRNIYVGTDKSGFIDNVFLYKPLPQINIYNADRKLVKIFTGDVTIDSLKSYIR